jgi:hypothetical protein
MAAVAVSTLASPIVWGSGRFISGSAAVVIRPS